MQPFVSRMEPKGSVSKSLQVSASNAVSSKLIQVSSRLMAQLEAGVSSLFSPTLYWWAAPKSPARPNPFALIIRVADMEI